MGIAIIGFGHYLPARRVGNPELAERFGVSEDWILAKTGIRERRYAAADEATSDLAVAAARDCLARAGVAASELDCLLVATMTPDQPCPSTAALVQRQLGAVRAWGFDLMAACSGFLYALQVGAALIEAGTCRTVLVCAADKMSSIIDPLDRKTTLVLADGAGACLLQRSDTANHLLGMRCQLDSTCLTDIVAPAGGSRLPATPALVAAGAHYLRFVSRHIGPEVLRLFGQAIRELLADQRLTLAQVDCLVPHQANLRLLEALGDDLGLPANKLLANVADIGNTSAATIPLAISQALRSGRLRGHETLLLAAVGAGYTYAAGLIKLHLSPSA
ncbi:3-oxoacyl-ACP synthase III family protein [Hymenobacter cheonanensis]|uniref:3-oxoacyl-ACP synthase III family protein n=1 Tax=Hymenobacter sp. CA2-7 TaxID=3063993 RepID=UPI002712CB32|nr:beta-ketoacyl-ACP synthase 3 [Hymenobacter sp. CA2-7]MDO7886640.1 beta-ketoacyl-ACP synthase 3 [Hymenobacter sp. CA2-7]